MLAAIREFFDQKLDGPAARADAGHTIELATAALLVETVRLDGGLDAAERASILSGVRTKFGLSDAEAADLLRLAEAESAQATDKFQFTSLVNKTFSAQQKELMIELMWRVAYADAVLSANEQHVMRKIADLLHVPHSNYIAAKLRARDASAP